MAKVITFSRTFPAYHPKAGQPTYFVEKFYNSLFSRNNLMDYPKGLEINESILEMKNHTIRAGDRWKVGDYFSPRVWSGKPYNSKQIIIAPDTEIKKVWDFIIDPLESGDIYVGGMFADVYTMDKIIENDGLQVEEFYEWFKYPKPFTGQIICWNENVHY